MGIIDDILDGVSQGTQVIKYAIIGGIILFAGIMILSAISQASQTLYDEREMIIDNIQKLCNYEDYVKAELSRAFANSLENEQARAYADRLLNDEILSDCEWQEFLTHLNNVEKRKLKISDLVCDAVNCIP